MTLVGEAEKIEKNQERDFQASAPKGSVFERVKERGGDYSRTMKQKKGRFVRARSQGGRKGEKKRRERRDGPKGQKKILKAEYFDTCSPKVSSPAMNDGEEKKVKRAGPSVGHEAKSHSPTSHEGAILYNPAKKNGGGSRKQG